MKGTLTIFILVAALIAAASPGAVAQAPTPQLGDYGSVASGTWGTAATWNMYSTTGQFDSTATVAPNDRAKSVFVRAGHTIDYLVSAQNMKNLVIEAGAVLRTSTTLPTGSPLYVRISGNTVWVDGSFGKDSTDALSIDCRFDGMITLAGSGIANVARLRPYSGLTGNMGFTFAMNAKINYNGSSGTGGAGLYIMNSPLLTSATVTIDSGVTVTFAPYSYMGLTSSSGTPGGVNATFNINGTLNQPASTSSIYLADSANYTVTMNVGPAGTVNVGGKLVPWLPLCNPAVINVAAGGVMNILDGGRADFTEPTSKVTGAGTFAVLPGGRVNVGAPAGLDPTNGPLQTTTVTLDTAAIYAYTGTGVQQWGPQRPKEFRGLVIGAASVDTVLATDTMSVYGTLQVDGLFIDKGGFRPDSLLTAVVNGTYQFNTVDTLSVIPKAAWSTGSTFLVTKCRAGVSTGIPGINQNFFNVTYDDPTTAGVPRFGFVNDTVKGNLYIKNTATNPADGTGNFVVLGKSGVSGNIVLLGNLVIDSAGSVSPGYGSGICTVILDVKGNIVTKGWMFMNGSGVSNKYLMRGDLVEMNPIAGAIRGHSSTVNPDSIVVCGTGIQNILKPVALISMNHVRWRVVPGSILWLNDTTAIPYSGNGVFVVDSGAAMVLGAPMGVNGNFLAKPTLSSMAHYIFHSGSAQVTGMWFPGTVGKFDVDDSLGLTLSDTVVVTDTLRLKTGNLAGTDTSMVSIASNGVISRTGNNYILGRLQKQFAAPGSKDFEVGTANGYSPVTVNVTTGTGAMTVAAVQGQHPSTFDAAKTLARYWTLSADTSVTQADLKFFYLAADVNGTESSYGAYRYSGTGTTWTPLTSVNNVGAHWVSTAGVTSFSDWTLGESSLATAVKSEKSTIPTVFYVDQNYPNPFNPATKISYGLPEAAQVTVVVYSVLGQEVATLQSGVQNAGTYTVTFDGSRLGSGVYFCRVTAGKSVAVRQMLLVK